MSNQMDDEYEQIEWYRRDDPLSVIAQFTVVVSVITIASALVVALFWYVFGV